MGWGDPSKYVGLIDEKIHHIFKTFSGTRRVAEKDSNEINFYLIWGYPIIKLTGQFSETS